MRRLRDAIVLATLGAVLLSGCAAVGGKPDASAQAIDVDPVEVTRGRIESVVSGTGTVGAESEATLSFKTTGRLESIIAHEGDTVKSGQTIALVDASALENTVRRAEAALLTAQARLAQAKRTATQSEVDQAELRIAQAKRKATDAEIAQAQASIDSAKANLARLQKGPTQLDIENAKLAIDLAKNSRWSAQAQRDGTAGSDFSSGSSKDAAEAAVLSADVNVRQAEIALERLLAPATDEDIVVAQAQVAQAEAQMAQILDRPKAEDVAMAEAQLAQLYERPSALDVAVQEASLRETQLSLALAKEALQDTRLLAPFDGVVVGHRFEVGENVSPGAPAVDLANLDQLKITMVLDEVDVAQVSEGQAAIVVIEAFADEKLDGTVERVAPVATQTASGVGFEVEVGFDPQDLAVRVGMTSQVDIVTMVEESALLVPNQAITPDRANNKYYVQLRSGASYVQTEIEIGMRSNDFSQVLSGLEEGDMVQPITLDLGSPEDDRPSGPMMMGGRG